MTKAAVIYEKGGPEVFDALTSAVADAEGRMNSDYGQDLK